METYRQGDVLLIRRKAAPKNLKPLQPEEEGRLILARGEVTGHHHSLAPSGATLALDEGGVMWLTVDELTAVTHQEHAAVELAPGVYEVRRQVEWSAVDAMPRNVAD